MSADRFEARYKVYKQLVGSKPDRQTRQRLPAGVAAALARQRPPPAHRRRPPRRSTSRRNPRKVTTPTTPAASASAACSPAGWSKSGARFIEVTTEYIPFLNWDTHDNGHTRLADLKKHIDRPIAQLVLDLEERGLLDRTLIVLASEFSRDMMIEGKPGASGAGPGASPGHDRGAEILRHAPPLHRSRLRADVRRRHEDAATSTATPPTNAPATPSTGRFIIEDLHATIYRALGICPKLAYEIESRPFYVTRDGLGKPIESVFA